MSRHETAITDPRISFRPDEGGDTARAPSMRLEELAFAVVDVETTGTSVAYGDRVTEVAVVTVGNGRITGVWEQLVNPGRLIPPMIEGLTGITNGMVQSQPTFDSVVPELASLLSGKVFTAHNAPFDWRFVSAEMERAGYVPPDGYPLCTIRLSRRLLPGLERRSLDSVARYLGIEIDHRHRASGDAVATARVLLRLLEAAAERGMERWGELAATLGRPPGRSNGRSVTSGRSLPSTATTDESA